jgi:hypothetical protein
MKLITLTTNAHDSCGEPSRKTVTEAQYHMLRDYQVSFDHELCATLRDQGFSKWDLRTAWEVAVEHRNILVVTSNRISEVIEAMEPVLDCLHSAAVMYNLTYHTIDCDMRKYGAQTITLDFTVQEPVCNDHWYNLVQEFLKELPDTEYVDLYLRDGVVAACEATRSDSQSVWLLEVKGGV